MGVAGWRGGITDLCPGRQNPHASTGYRNLWPFDLIVSPSLVS